MSGWRPFFLALHIAQIIFIIALLKDYHFVDPALYDAVKAEKSRDIIQLAGQLGRFDMASMFLAGIAILLGMAAIFGFLEVRSKAIRVAKDEATLEAARVAQEVAELQIRPEAERSIEAFFERKGIDITQLPTKSDTIATEAGDLAAAMESKKDG